jgi:hypothetical protein
MSRTLLHLSMSVVLATSSVAAQVATSPKHVLVDHSLGGGGRPSSAKFELTGAFGPSCGLSTGNRGTSVVEKRV